MGCLLGFARQLCHEPCHIYRQALTVAVPQSAGDKLPLPAACMEAFLGLCRLLTLQPSG